MTIPISHRCNKATLKLLDFNAWMKLARIPILDTIRTARTTFRNMSFIDVRIFFWAKNFGEGTLVNQLPLRQSDKQIIIKINT